MNQTLKEINEILKEKGIHTEMVKNALHIYCIYRSITIYDDMMYAYGKKYETRGYDKNDLLHLIATEYQGNNEGLIKEKCWISFLESLGYEEQLI